MGTATLMPRDEFELDAQWEFISQIEKGVDVKPDYDLPDESVGADATVLGTNVVRIVWRAPEDLLPPWHNRDKESTTFVALQSWEGYVVEITATDLFVRLVDKTNPENPEVSTSFSINELDDEDRAFASVGAVFYWAIGYAQSPSGRRRNSIIRFKRVPAWTKLMRDRAKEERDGLCELLGVP